MFDASDITCGTEATPVHRGMARTLPPSLPSTDKASIS